MITESGNIRENPINGEYYWIKYDNKSNWTPAEITYPNNEMYFRTTVGYVVKVSLVYDFIHLKPPVDEPIIATGIAEGPNGIMS